jgi:hypothetical protein
VADMLWLLLLIACLVLSPVLRAAHLLAPLVLIILLAGLLSHR